ncbi:HNH endonuclease [Brachybacterium squillarum]|uniref:HNH endonuclease n=1 Tax=Brachybacterium squillarum TaxID=661979 RepID=UPI000A02BF6C|nr:HNH endonuclease [Brachybacterium squillarum]
MAINNLHAFVLQWNPKDFNWEQNGVFEEAVRTTRTGGVVQDRWTTGNRTKNINPGDRIFLRLTGNRGRGIIASGRAASKVKADANAPKLPYRNDSFIQVFWDTVLPIEEVLPLRELEIDAPSAAWQAPGGGVKIESDRLPQVEAAWQSHLLSIDNSQKDSSADESVLREYGLAEVRRRKHQKRFRQLLLTHYPHECYVCGLNQVQVLEAAHLVPDSKGGESSIENGRLLCPNHHRALDTKPPLLRIIDDKPVWVNIDRAF